MSTVFTYLFLTIPADLLLFMLIFLTEKKPLKVRIKSLFSSSWPYASLLSIALMSYCYSSLANGHFSTYIPHKPCFYILAYNLGFLRLDDIIPLLILDAMVKFILFTIIFRYIIKLALKMKKHP